VNPETVSAASSIAALAAEHAAEGERQRRLTAPVVDALRDAGYFRLCVPEEIGGSEAHPGTLVQIVEELARGDAAAGWCVAVQATSGLVGGWLPPDGAREIFGDPEAVWGGVFAPRGKAVLGNAGWTVSGRWPFASGCQHSTWLMGGAVTERDGAVVTLPNGMPDIRLMLAPADSFAIHDTWRVAGLRGTGSHDIELTAATIPERHAASVIADTPSATGALYAFPLFGLLAVAIAGVSLGCARGALDDIVDLAGGKVPTGGRKRLADRTTVQADVARAEAAVRAARALLHSAIDEAWQHAEAQGEIPVEARMALRLAASHAAAVCAEVTHSAYVLGGGTALYETSPLQRRFRDANAVTQHMLVAPATWELSGRLLLGLPTDATQL
jgi:alkylation response protein AidB-like acyl-CoA dehydrogenase